MARKKQSRKKTASPRKPVGRADARRLNKRSASKKSTGKRTTGSSAKTGTKSGGSRPGSAGRPRRSRRAPVSSPMTGPQRLQRVLAAAGIGSRRACEELIETGRVQVDDAIVTKLGTKVDPDEHEIFVDGQRVSIARREYYMLNKPPGIISTSNDPSGRMRVIDLIKTRQRVYNVGRLDQSSEGLILVTNDGDLANRLTHPRYGVAKTYHVQVQGVPEREKLQSLVQGIYLADGKARVANVKFKRRSKNTSWLEIVLEEGRNREIRRLLARIGHKVLTLRRMSIGPLLLGELPVGAHRRLTLAELKDLRATVEGRSIRKRTATKKAVTRKSTPRKDATRKDATRKKATQKRSMKTTVKSARTSPAGKTKPARKRVARNDSKPRASKKSRSSEGIPKRTRRTKKSR